MCVCVCVCVCVCARARVCVCVYVHVLLVVSHFTNYCIALACNSGGELCRVVSMSMTIFRIYVGDEARAARLRMWTNIFFSRGNLAHHWNGHKNKVGCERCGCRLVTILGNEWALFFKKIWLVRGILFIHFFCLIFV